MKKLLIFLILLCALTISAFSQSGKITGKLTYPSDYIPPEMILCVESNGGQTYCSNERTSRLRRGKISFRLNYLTATYRVDLPAGNYYLYATFPKGKAPTDDMEGIKAYYNEFVKCGMSVDCESKKPIAVKVKAGRTAKGITVGDWY